MARASAGEVREQLYVALDQKYIDEGQFEEVYASAETCARQIAHFIAYLESNPRKRRLSDDDASYEV